MQIRLASQSPRRFQILKQFGFDVTVILPGHADEGVLGDPGMEAPDQVVMINARHKAESVPSGRDWLLASDTIVVLGEHQFGKPKDALQAGTFLGKLSGHTHQVYSSYYLIKGETVHQGYDVSDVTFHELTREQICDYIQSIHVLDKAGAYAIQDGGDSIIKDLKGSYFNVMGLPIEKIMALGLS